MAGDVPTWPPAEQQPAVRRTYAVQVGGREGAAMLQESPDGWWWTMHIAGGPSMQGGPFSTPADAERAMVCSGVTIAGMGGVDPTPADPMQAILNALDPLDARLRGVVVEGPGLDVGACVVPLVPDGPALGRRLAEGNGRRASIIGVVEGRAVVVRAVVWGGAG